VGKAVGGNAVIEARLAAAQGLSEPDGHALAGFLDAEATFAITPNNQGRNWRCQMSVVVRLDDGDVLSDLCACTGLGRVSVTPARRTSRPQATWSVASKRECVELVRILRRFPLRARKRRDAEIWSAAVERWSSMLYDGRADRGLHAEMARNAEALRSARRYVNTPPPALGGPVEALLWYLGGFFSGEGYFGLSRLRPQAVIKLRGDDRSILELFASRFDVGLVRNHPGYGGDHPSVTWRIGAARDLSRTICVFDAAQLRGRKRREFEVWRQAAYERAHARITRRRADRVRLERVAGDLRLLREYRPPPDDAFETRSDAERDAQVAYVEILRALAAEVPAGPLTCGAYSRARKDHAEWPNRDTITRAFGGWAQALRAAGLDSRLSARSARKTD
jgi:hypothetical protein